MRVKLKNKKTGEIGNLVLNTNPNRESYSVLSTENGDTICGNLVVADYDTLAELNAEWEDYEEPKDYYFIRDDGAGIGYSPIGNCPCAKCRKKIANYFDTREEAEKAVEKLKAWKRLKDKGFRFELWDYDGGNYQERIRTGRILFRVKDYEEVDELLDLLFGGEE